MQHNNTRTTLNTRIAKHIVRTTMHMVRPYKTNPNQQGDQHLEEMINIAFFQMIKLYKALGSDTEIPGTQSKTTQVCPANNIEGK